MTTHPNWDSLKELMPPIDPFAFAEIMGSIGNCLWRIQQLEESVEQYLVAVLHVSGAIAEGAAQSVLEDKQKRPLGQLVRELGGQASVPETISSRLQAFVANRNWVVHRSHRETYRMLSSQQRRSELDARIAGITEEAAAIQRLIAEEMERALLAAGHTPEELLQRVRASMRERYGA